jgi:hypothetical protein
MDSTGIQSNVDIKLEGGPWLTIEDVKKSFNKVGLDLLLAKKSMKVLVIRDAATLEDG